MNSFAMFKLFVKWSWLAAMCMMSWPLLARAEFPQPELVAEITRKLQDRAVKGASITQRVSALHVNIQTRYDELVQLEAAVASHSKAIGQWGDQFVSGARQWLPDWDQTHSVNSCLEVLERLPKTLPILPEEHKLGAQEDILIRSAGTQKYRCLVDLTDLRETTRLSQRVFDLGTSAYQQVAQDLARTRQHLEEICAEFNAIQNTVAGLPIARHRTRQNILALWQKTLRHKLATLTHQDLGVLRQRADSLEGSWRLREDFTQKVDRWAQRRRVLSEVMHAPRWAIRLARTWRYSIPGLRQRSHQENIHPEVRSELEIDMNESESLAKQVLLRAEDEVENRLAWHAQQRGRSLQATSQRRKVAQTSECRGLRKRAEAPDSDDAEDAYLSFMEGCR